MLQILDDGRLTDAHGKTVNFENTVIVMTTNAGSDRATGSIGFGGSEEDRAEDATMKALSSFLRPEFINRVDEVVCFNQLTEENFRGIAKLMLKELSDVLSERGKKLTWDESLIDHLVKSGYSVTYGARNLRRLIQKEIEDVVAQKVIEKRGENASVIELSAHDGKVQVNVRGEE